MTATPDPRDVRIAELEAQVEKLVDAMIALASRPCLMPHYPPITVYPVPIIPYYPPPTAAPWYPWWGTNVSGN